MNKLDKSIRKKLHDRTIKPSDSAWERMSEQLDTLEKQKSRKWFWYLGYAASIVLFLSIYFLLEKEDMNQEIVPEEIYVNQPVDSFKTKGRELDLTPSTKEVIVLNSLKTVREKSLSKDEIVSKSIDRSNPEFISEKNYLNIEVMDTITDKENRIDKTPNSIQIEIEKAIKPKVNSHNSIVVDSDALLYAVTHNQEEVNKYYKKYMIARQDALKAVEDQLKTSKVKLDPEMILAEVEMELIEDNFQNNFFKNLKKKVSEVITFIANRNN